MVEVSVGGQTTPLAGGSRPETSIDAEEVRSSAAHLVQFYEADECWRRPWRSSWQKGFRRGHRHHYRHGRAHEGD